MNKARKRIRVTDVNPNLICILCSGYFIDATTLTECLHSFCKTCIVKYLETSKSCPICDVTVHKTRPHLHIRSDKTLQDLVYKLVPGLYKNEMKRRRDFYSQNPDAAPSKVGEERGDENAERILYTKDDKFSLSLHFCSQGVKDERTVRTLTLPEMEAASAEQPSKNVRYLQCLAGVTVEILKRFIRIKYELAENYLIDIFHTDESLRDEYTLVDVAYIYTWRGKEPLKLNFSVYEFIVKRRKLHCPRSSRLLDLKNLIKHETKDSPTKTETKPDIKPTQPHLRPGNNDKLGKQGDQGQNNEALEMEPVKEEPGLLSSAVTRQIEPMDTTPADQQNQQQEQQSDQQAACLSFSSNNKFADKLEQVKVEEKDEDKSSVKLENGIGNNTMVTSGIGDKASVTLEEKPTGKSVETSVSVMKSPSKISVSVANSSESVNKTPSKPSTPKPKTLLFRNSSASSPVKTKSGVKPDRSEAVSKASVSRIKTVPLEKAFVSVDSVETVQHKRSAVSAGSARKVLLGSTKVSLDGSVKISGGEVEIPFGSPKTSTVDNVKVPLNSHTRDAVSTSHVNSSLQSSVCVRDGKTATLSSAGTVNGSPMLIQSPVKEEVTSAKSEVGATSVEIVDKKMAVFQQPHSAQPTSSTGTTSVSSASAIQSAASMPCRSEGTSATGTMSNMTVSYSKPKLDSVLPAQASSRLLPPVSLSTAVPSAAAAAAGAASPSPAALAASSSPSPPMASSAASVKDMVEQPQKRAVTSSSHSVTVPATKAVTSGSSFKPSSSLPKTLTASPAAASVKDAVADSSSTPVLKLPSKQKSCTPSSDQATVPVSTLSVTGSGDRSSILSVASGNSPKVTTEQLPGSNGSDSSRVNVSTNSGSVKQIKNSTIGTLASASSGGGQKLGLGARSALPGHAAGPLSGRNGMPAVVTKPTRVNNASTSVNTLLHKLPVTTAHQAPAKSSDSPSPAAAGTCGTASPVCKQPSKPIVPTEQTVKQSPSSPVKTPALNVKQTAKPSGNAVVSTALKQPNRRTGVVASVPGQPSRPVGSSTPGPSRPSSSSTPVPIQPQPVVSSSQPVVSMACNPLALSIARRAGDMQFQHALAQQVTQQQFMEMQLQQHYLQMHAFAARYNMNLLRSSAMGSPGHPAVPVVSAASASPQSSTVSQNTDCAKKQPGEISKKMVQSSTASRKGGESSPKKKITDIANSLHKKMSQTLGSSTSAKSDDSAASSDKRPPYAHTPKLGNNSTTGSSAGAKSRVSSSVSKEDEPLNLVVTRSDCGSTKANTEPGGSAGEKLEGEKH